MNIPRLFNNICMALNFNLWMMDRYDNKWKHVIDRGEDMLSLVILPGHVDIYDKKWFPSGVKNRTVFSNKKYLGPASWLVKKKDMIQRRNKETAEIERTFLLP